MEPEDDEKLLDFLESDEFVELAAEATRQARQESLDAGFPVFGTDEEGRMILEQPDGKRFEIRFRPNEYGSSNYDILRELSANAA
jgi:hypothetical protein